MIAVLESILQTHSHNNNNNNVFVSICVVNAINSLILSISRNNNNNNNSSRLAELFRTLADVYRDNNNNNNNNLGIDQRILIGILHVAVGSLCLPTGGGDQLRLCDQMRLAVQYSNNNNNYPGSNVTLTHQEFLGSVGFCECISHSFISQSSDAMWLETALRAVFYLSLRCESNQKKFAGLSVSKAVVGVLHGSLGMLLDNQHTSGMVFYCCLAVAGLASNDKENSTELGKQNVCDFVAKALTKFSDNEDVVEACCYAIFGLKALNQWLGRAGVVRML